MIHPLVSCSKQKYAKKKLLAFDSQSGLLEVDTFFIPSCCVCQLILDITRTSEPLTSPVGEGPLFGASNDGAQPQASPFAPDGDASANGAEDIGSGERSEGDGQ